VIITAPKKNYYETTLVCEFTRKMRTKRPLKDIEKRQS
jgi:hypothetical protein